MTEKDNVMQSRRERNILRKVYRYVTEQGIWRIRNNQELRNYTTPLMKQNILKEDWCSWGM
jgi:hypothetical protein